MAVIASLNVLLGIDSAGFSAGAKKSMRELDAFAKSAMALNATIGVISTGFQQAERVLGSFSETANQIADVADLADSTGFSTEGLVSLQHGAKLAGVDVEELNSALTKMTVTLGKSLNGGGASEALDRLGLSAQQLVTIAPEDALGKIADSISALPTPAERAAAAVELFGKSGANLLNFLSGGSQGIRAMRQEADALGITFSRLDAERVAEANDAIDRLTAAFSALKQELLIGLGPALNIAATGLTKMLVALRQGDILGGLDILGSMAEAQEEIQRAAEDAFYQGQAAREAAKENKLYADSLGEVGAAAGQLGESGAGLSNVEQLLKRLREDQLLSGLSGIERDVGKLAIEGVHGEELFNVKSEAAKLKALEEENALRKHADELMKESVPPEKQFADLERRITELAEAGKISWEQYMALYEEGAAKLNAATTPKIQPPKDLQADAGPTHPRALLKGTAEAFSFILKSGEKEKELQKMLDISKDSLGVLKELNTKLGGTVKLS